MPDTSADLDAEAGTQAGLFRFLVDSAHHGSRLDRALADLTAAAGLGLSRTRLQALIADGHVTIAGAVASNGKVKVVVGECGTLAVPEPRLAEPIAQPMSLHVFYEDRDLLIIDKPAGLVVHPAAGHADGTLVNALLAHCGDSLSGIGGVKRPGIVHRLDKDTSGLLVVAKTDAAHAGLSAVFADHGRSGSLVRDYLAFVWGVPDRTTGTIKTDLGRDPHNRLKVAVVPPGRGRHAVTHWSVVRRFGEAASLIRCRLETGRTHQIRVHLTALGHAIIGDPVYGTHLRTKAARLEEDARQRATQLARQALHAASLGFAHPVTGEPMLFQSALPPDLEALGEALAKQSA